VNLTCVVYVLLQEHEKTKKEIVDALKMEVSDLKKELQQRKKLVAMQQQIIQHGSETYNKVISNTLTPT